MKKLTLLCLLATLIPDSAGAQQTPDSAQPLTDPSQPLLPPQPPKPSVPALEPPMPAAEPLLPPRTTTSIPRPPSQMDLLREKLDAIGNLRVDLSNISITKEGGVIKPANGLLHFESDGMEVFAGQADYISATEQLRFSGDVAIYRDGLIYRGDNAVYNISTKQLDATNMRSSVEPLFFKAANLRSTGGGSEISVIDLDSPEFTTEDSEDPSYRVTADSVSIYPNDRVVFRKFRVKAGDSTIFYLPGLTQTFDGELAYMVLPGYRSSLGAYLLNQYSTTVGDHSVIKYKLDLYSERGVGTGFDFESRRFDHDSRFGKFKFYWLYDTDPKKPNTFDTASRDDVEKSRYRINLQHRIYLPGPEQGDFYVDIDINKISDAFFYEDFFPHDLRDEPQPDNIVNFVKRGDRGEISLAARFHANDFYETDTRLPEFAIDRVRQPLWNTRLFYSAQSSIGVLEERYSDNVPGIEPAFTRSYSWNELYYPMAFSDGAITVIPRIGAGYAGYSNINGPDPDDTSRFIFSAGLDAAVKFSRVYDDVVVPWLGLDGLRHIVQPYVTWSFVSADELGGSFMGIDTLAPSTRPRPLDVTNFTAIDSLRDWNIIRLGVSNRLQTRRNRTTYNWLTSNTYIDAFIDDPEYNRDFSNLYEDIEWRPVPWGKLSIGAQVPISDQFGNFTEINTRATFMPADFLEFSIGHRMLSNHPVFHDSSLVDFGAYARVNEHWGFSIYERYELDDNTLETQQYSIHRDLTSWVASLGAIIRDSREGHGDDWGVLLSLTLKDFPAVRLPVDFDPQGGRR
jgi:LPS-assembly protein